MTKKLIATALVGAFSISATAAEVSITGDYEFSFKSVNNSDTANTDGDFNIKATEELDNGITVSADFNINATGANDGDNSLTIKGGLGTLDLGDTASAVDAIDDVTAWGLVLAQGSLLPDHSVLYTAPSIGGITANFSYAAPDGNPDSNTGGHGASIRYKGEAFSVGYGQVEQQDGTEYVLTNGTVSLAGINLSAETTTTTDTSDVDTDNTIFGATYSINDVKLGYENKKTESEGTTSAHVSTYGVHYKIASPLIAFVEYSTDSKDDDADTSVVGITYKF